MLEGTLDLDTSSSSTQEKKITSKELGELLVATRAIRSEIDMRNRSIPEVEEKFMRIKMEYPSFFDIIVTDVKSPQIIKFMLELTQRKESGEITKERADIEMGQFMAGHYLPTDAELRARKERESV